MAHPQVGSGSSTRVSYLPLATVTVSGPGTQLGPISCVLGNSAELKRQPSLSYLPSEDVSLELPAACSLSVTTQK